MKMGRVRFIGIALLLMSTTTKAQLPESIDALKSDVSTLSGKKFQGREAGTKGAEATAKYIAKRFEEIGLTPMGLNNTFYQHFSFAPGSEPQAVSEATRKNETLKECRNIIGFINNNGRNTVVIGAHYDHLGYGSSTANEGKKKEVYNGADDNASGIGAILMLAEKLKQKKDAMNNYIIIAFSGKEKGFLGSTFYIKEPTIRLSKLNCMLNFDMVGRLNDGHLLTIEGTGTSPKWNSLLDKVEVEGIKVQLEKSGLGHSDHSAFYVNGLPVLNFFTGMHADYHLPTDDVEKIDFPGIAKTVQYAEKVLEGIDQVLKLAYTTTEDTIKRKTWPAGSYHIKMGVMPDYTYNGAGLRIEDVVGNRPAERAGMRNGDIVKKLGGIEINDLNSYVKALQQVDKKERTTVQFDRGGQLMELELEF